MKRVMRLSAADLDAERVESADDDVHFPEALVRAVLDEYTSVGDRVLDPFAGFGTTLAVSQRMGREAVGIELLPERVEAIRRRAGPGALVIEGDARHLDDLPVGPIDLCMTSPPYMTSVAHPWNPLNAYQTLDGDYQTYLAELSHTFAAVVRHLRTGGHIVINAGNISHRGTVTPLAWDITRELIGIPPLIFVGETYLEWDVPPGWLSGDYCLVFRKTAETPGGDEAPR
jgi:DNA modification methylase